MDFASGERRNELGRRREARGKRRTAVAAASMVGHGAGRVDGGAGNFRRWVSAQMAVAETWMSEPSAGE